MESKIGGVKCVEEAGPDDEDRKTRIFRCRWADRFHLCDALIGDPFRVPARHPDDPHYWCEKAEFSADDPPRESDDGHSAPVGYVAPGHAKITAYYRDFS